MTNIRRMGETGTVPAVPPLWAGKEPGSYEMEVRYVGKELADHPYPIKSFYDAGANVVFHSDYPVSPIFDIEKVAEANLIATVVGGEEVYKT